MPYVLKHDAPTRYDIPAALAREIGRFIVAWANFEDYVQSLIWRALDLSHEEGRIAVRESRITERLDILREIAGIRNFELDFVLLAEISKRADKLAANRHLLAHSVWQKPGSYWIILKTRGSWSQAQSEIAEHLQGSKSIEPEAVAITPEDVRGWTEEAIALMGDVEKLNDNPRPKPLPEKRKKRSVPRDRSCGRTGSGRKSPRPASRG
jgi:hypothetical protein